MKNIEFDVTGMSCASCSAHVEKAVNSLKGVENTSVNLLQNSMTVVFDETKISESDIIRAVKDAGYGTSVKKDKAEIAYKSKKKIENPESEQMLFKNTHEAIIDLDTWEKVQELRKNKRRPTRLGKTNMFSGIVYCADCGKKLYYCTSKNFESRQDHFGILSLA